MAKTPMVVCLRSFTNIRKLVWTNALSYQTSIGNDHHIDALVGYEIDDSYRDYLSGYATNFATADKNEISNGMKTGVGWWKQYTYTHGLLPITFKL